MSLGSQSSVSIDGGTGAPDDDNPANPQGGDIYVDDKGVEHVAAALPQTEEEPIKEVGTYEAEANLHKGIKQTFKFEVVGE